MLDVVALGMEVLVIGANGGGGMHHEYVGEKPNNYQMKVDFPSFNGHLHIKDFLDWVTEVERFFEYMCIPENRKVKLMAYKFKAGALYGWGNCRFLMIDREKGP